MFMREYHSLVRTHDTQNKGWGKMCQQNKKIAICSSTQ